MAIINNSRSVKVTQTSPYRCEVLLDGADIANGIDGLTVTMRAGRPASVELSIPVIDITEIQDADARVYISPASRDALTALGWTAPGEAGEGESPTGHLMAKYAEAWSAAVRATEEPDPDPLPPYIDVKEYRTDDGRNAWVFRCWGDGHCDGALHLDLDNHAYAERKVREHVAEAHGAAGPTP